jgi:hypothetical protein
MSNNMVILDGWLFVRKEDITQVPLEPGKKSVAVYGYILTDKAYKGGRHPLTLLGKPAKIIRDFAALVPGDTLSIRALVEGSLVSMQNNARVQVRYITLFGRDQVLKNELPVHV